MDLSRHLGFHIPTLLVITLAVLPAGHLSFATPALLVATATFTSTLKKKKLFSITIPPPKNVYSSALFENWCAF